MQRIMYKKLLGIKTVTFMLISLIFSTMVTIGTINMEFHNSKYPIKPEQDIQTMQGGELSLAVVLMLGDANIPPDSSILTTEDDYTLLVNYFCNGSEEYGEGISAKLYSIFLFYPQKLDETIKHIDSLSEDKRKKAEEQLCFHIFDHYCAYYRYDLDGFFVRFPLLETRYKAIIQSIYERTKPFEEQQVSYSEVELNHLSHELNRTLNSYVILNEVQISDAVLKTLKSEAPFYFDEQYVELIHYWLSGFTIHSTEISTRVYQVLYCEPEVAERLCRYIKCLPEDSSKIATNCLVETVVSEYIKDSGIFEERIFFLKFPSMKQYSDKIFQHSRVQIKKIL